MDKMTEIIPELSEQWMIDALERGQLWNALISRLGDYKIALEIIVSLHGSKEHARHECTEMANVARLALANKPSHLPAKK